LTLSNSKDAATELIVYATLEENILEINSYFVNFQQTFRIS